MNFYLLKIEVLKQNATQMEKLIFTLVVLTEVLKRLQLLMKKNLVIYWKLKIYISQCYLIFWSVENIQKVKPRGF